MRGKRLGSFLLALVMVIGLIPFQTLNVFAANESWKLVTDVSNLKAGDQIVIVAKDANYALSTTQNSNNRGQAAVTKNNTDKTVSWTGSDVQILTLEAGTKSGTYAFNTGDGYLYAASSSKNYLRTGDKNDNASWAITIADGAATIKAQGSYTRNVMQYNQQSSLFACYSSASQQAIVIYKLTAEGGEVPSCEHVNAAPGEAKEATCTETGLTAGLYCPDCETWLEVQQATPLIPHNYVDGVCTGCPAAEPTLPNVSASDKYYIATIRSSGNYFYMTSVLDGGKRYTAVDSGLTELPESITAPENGYVFVITKNTEATDGTYLIYADGVEGNNYLGWTSGNSGILVEKANALVLTLVVNQDGTVSFKFTNGSEERYLSLNGTGGNNYFAWYTGTQKQNLVLIPVAEATACEHSFTNYESNNDATCTKDGTKTAACDKGCGAEDTVADVGSKLEHSFTNYVSNNDATCTADGTKTAACDYNCGTKDTMADAGSKLEHSFTNYVSNNDATCDADGTKTAACDRGCGETHTVTDEGSKLIHKYTNYVPNNDATCKADGTKTATCDNPGCSETHTVTDEGTKLTHSFTNYVSNGDATCKADGTKTATCDRGCGEEHTVTDEGTKLTHSFTNYVSNNDATCTADGTKTATCDRGCGEKHTMADVGSEKGHKWAAATCTAPKTCSRCGETEGEKLAHNYVNGICTACQAKMKHYVSLGASNTNGYGLNGYLPPAVSEDPLAASKANMNVYGYLRDPETAYPAQIADALCAELHQLAISSMRTEEVLYLLGEEYDYVNDAYMNWRFTGGQSWFYIAESGGVDALREAYKNYLTNADVITIDLGWNNFGVYAFNNVKTILADGNFWKEPDWDAIPEELISKEDCAEIRAQVTEMLKENMDSTSETLAPKMEKMVDVLTYATLGAIAHFDTIVEQIYEWNPDAQIVVINIQNLADDLVVEFEGETLKLGDLYGELIDLVNLYRASQSPYADKYAFANAGDVETFLDEIVAWDGDPTTMGGDMKDCFDMYDDSLYVRSIVEYMMVGQALSGLFQGFRDMAAEYGLEVFKNDEIYTYEFALTRTPEQLLALDLAKLDLSHPAGEDKDVEEYGKALAQHLKNLRGDEANVAAYDYVFDNLLRELSQQRDTLLEQVENVPEEYWPAELKAGVAQLNEAINVIVPGAKAEFAKKLQAVYTTYHNTLNYAYDVVATIVQYAAGINEMDVNAESLNGFNDAANGMKGIIFNDVINGAMAKFNYELYTNGLSDKAADEVPDYVLDENKFDASLTAILVLAVRYELGNSFFAHPNEAGHDQITEAVLKALVESDADDFTNTKMDLYMDTLKEKYPNLYAMLMGGSNLEDVDDLSIIIQMLKMSGSPALAGYDLDALEAQIRAELRAFEDAHTEEEAAEAKAACAKLYRSLIALATAATVTKYVPTEDSYYVSLGDSTINGYGLSGYIDNMQNGVNQVVSGSAHVLLAQEIFGDNWKNQFANFCQGSLRADDLLLFLGGDVVLDDYYYAEIEPNLMEGTLEATQEKFVENVENADLISVAIGGGNFLTFAGKYVNRAIANDPYELNWERIGVDENNANMKELEEALDLLVPIIDALGLMDQYVPEGVEIENPAKYARALAEGLLYGYASYNYYYSQVLERIKEINPDAQLLILGMFNPVDDWTMTITIDGEETVVNIGGAVGNLMESANLQTLAFALQHENTSFVDVSDAETILEAQNPGAEFGFEDYYSSSFQTNGKAVHASEDGHKYIAKQMYTAITTEFTVPDETIETLLYIINEYYDEAYAHGYQYALATGYIDAAIAAIDKAIAELNAIDVDAYEMTDALKAEAQATIDELVETLEAAKALLTEADELDQASLEALLALLNEADDIAVALKNVFVQAGIDTTELVIIPYITNELIPAVKQAVIEIATKAAEHLEAKLTEVAEDLIDAIIETLPGVDAALYSWLYNNPEKVIAFFNEYGDEMLALMEEYGDETLAVIGFVLYNYGEEMAGYVIENHEVILANIAKWADTYGDEVWEMAKVYLDALGILDQLHAAENRVLGEIARMEAAISGLEAQLIALKAQLEQAIAAGDAALAAQLQTAIEKVEAQIAQIKAMIAQIKSVLEQLQKDIAAVEAAIRNIVAIIERGEALDVILPILKDALNELVDAIASAIDTAALLETLETALKKLIAEGIDSCVNYLKSIGEAAVDAIAEELERALKAASVEVSNYVKNLFNMATNKITNFIQQLIEDALHADQIVNDETRYEAITGNSYQYVSILGEKLWLKNNQYGMMNWDTLDYAKLAQADLITVGYDEANLNAFAVEQLLGYVKAYLENDLAPAMTAYVEELIPALAYAFTLQPEAFAGLAENVELIMNELVNHELLADREMQPMDWAALVGEENLPYVEQARAELEAMLAENGVIESYTIQINIVDYLFDNAAQLGLAQMLQYVSREQLKEKLGETAVFTVEIPVREAVVFAAESFLYGNLEFQINYAETLIVLSQLNPEATVVALGGYNAFREIALNMGDVELNLGETYENIVKLTSASSFAYALALPNVIYVDIADAQTNYEMYVEAGYIENTFANFLMAYLTDETMTQFSSVGHAYIAEQIYNSLTVTCEHIYDDECTDTTCNRCGEERVAPGHSFTNYVSNGDATCTADGTKTAVCDKCDCTDTMIDEGTKLTHSFTNYVSNGDATCTADGTKTAVCDHGCGEKHTVTDAGSKLAHTVVIIPGYGATCTANGKTEGRCCSVCQKVLTAQETIPAKGHTEVTDAGKAATCTETGLTEGKHCSVCNEVLTAQETIPALGHTEVTDAGKAATCTETGLTEGKHCSVCNEVLTAQETIPALGHTEVTDAGKAATCTETGLTEGKHCSVCNKVLTAQETIPAKGHTEVTDAGKAATCTETGLTEGKHCSVCNEILVAQQTLNATGHSFGAWIITKEATATEAGVETRTCGCGETETREIPMLPAPAKDNTTVVIIVVVVAVVGIGAAAAFVFLKKKRA